MGLFSKKPKAKDVAPANDNQTGDIFDKVFGSTQEIPPPMPHVSQRQNEQPAPQQAPVQQPVAPPQPNVKKPEPVVAPASQIKTKPVESTPLSEKTTKKPVDSTPLSTVGAKQTIARVGLSSVIGKRDYQQDAAAVSSYAFKQGYANRWMAILCDGMGGMNGGERASALCIDMMMQAFANIGNQSIPHFLNDNIIETDYAVADLRDNNGDYLGGGSTLITTIIDGDQLYWGSVGDSHIYIIRGRNMKRLNEEHNYYVDLLEMVNRGEITIEQANSDPHREALTSYMGIGGLTLIDINGPLTLHEGDMVILCSDGLYRSVTQKEMYDIMQANAGDMQMAAQALTDCAMSKNKKYQDNTTVITIRYI